MKEFLHHGTVFFTDSKALGVKLGWLGEFSYNTLHENFSALEILGGEFMVLEEKSSPLTGLDKNCLGK